MVNQVVDYDFGMWRAAGISARASFICHVYCRPDSADRESRIGATIVCKKTLEMHTVQNYKLSKTKHL